MAENWLHELYVRAKELSPEQFKKEYLGEFDSEYPEDTLISSTIVIAESFDVFMRSRLPRYWKYIARLPQDIRGYQNCTLILYGRYWRCKGWSYEVIDYCRSHNIEIIRISEE